MAFWKINENDASPSKQGIMQQEDPEDQHKKDAENSDDSDGAKSQGFGIGFGIGLDFNNLSDGITLAATNITNACTEGLKQAASAILAPLDDYIEKAKTVKKVCDVATECLIKLSGTNSGEGGWEAKLYEAAKEKVADLFKTDFPGNSQKNESSDGMEKADSGEDKAEEKAPAPSKEKQLKFYYLKSLSQAKNILQNKIFSTGGLDIDLFLEVIGSIYNIIRRGGNWKNISDALEKVLNLSKNLTTTISSISSITDAFPEIIEKNSINEVKDEDIDKVTLNNLYSINLSELTAIKIPELYSYIDMGIVFKIENNPITISSNDSVEFNDKEFNIKYSTLNSSYSFFKELVSSKFEYNPRSISEDVLYYYITASLNKLSNDIFKNLLNIYERRLKYNADVVSKTDGVASNLVWMLRIKELNELLLNYEKNPTSIAQLLYDCFIEINKTHSILEDENLIQEAIQRTSEDIINDFFNNIENTKTDKSLSYINELVDSVINIDAFFKTIGSSKKILK